LPVLKYWDEQPHVIESDPNDDWNWETELKRFPEWRQQLIAELNGKSIGFIQIIDPLREETHYWGDIEADLRAIDVWIGEEQYLGKGYGTEMMKLAIDLCFSETSVKGILIDPLESNKNAIRFYEKLGFKFVENKTFGPDFCSVYRLNREQYEVNDL
jgi:aminoglycoside 6'-N-acetyltransferase